MARDQVDVAERLAPYEAHHRPLPSHGTSFDGLIWLQQHPVLDLRDPEPAPAEAGR